MAVTVEIVMNIEEEPASFGDAAGKAAEIKPVVSCGTKGQPTSARTMTCSTEDGELDRFDVASTTSYGTEEDAAQMAGETKPVGLCGIKGRPWFTRTTTCSTDDSDLDLFDVASPNSYCTMPETPLAEPMTPLALPETPPVAVAPGVVHDVVASAAGEPMLVPATGGARGSEAVRVADLADDAVVTVRVFRFFEDAKDAKGAWERELRTVNSGSLLWVPVHLEPKMHSTSGAKYGRWFTVHHIEVLAKHLGTGYFMCEEGSCLLARTFGSTRGVTRLITGKDLSEGYLWFVTPHREIGDDDALDRLGWRHVHVEGPIDGTKFLTAWKAGGMSMETPDLQECMNAYLSAFGARSP